MSVQEVASETVTFTRIVPDADVDALVDFTVTNSFPFHVHTRPPEELARQRVLDGRYDDEDHRGFWIDVAPHGRVGLVVLEDLSDDAPLFDLRLAERFRGQGLGVTILRALTEHVFTTMPEVNRFEGQTRDDNIAMRKTFLRAGFVKEAHYREAWPVIDGPPRASVAYAILRRDWKTGGTTALDWDDLPR